MIDYIFGFVETFLIVAPVFFLVLAGAVALASVRD